MVLNRPPSAPTGAMGGAGGTAGEHRATSDSARHPMTDTTTFVHPSAVVEDGVRLGVGVMVWHRSHLRTGAEVGDHTRIGEGVHVGAGVRVGANCKIQNGALLYEGCRLEDGVFIGPGVIVTNDRHPRAVNPDGSLRTAEDWTLEGVVVETGASIGAGALILAGVRVGRWAVVGAGSLVTEDVTPHSLVLGIPARPVGSVCFCGRRCTGCETCGWSEGVSP